MVAGVDFSHIGLRFSHPVAAVEMLEETRRHDRDLMEAFSRGDADTFWKREAATGGKFNVCGFSTSRPCWRRWTRRGRPLSGTMSGTIRPPVRR